MELLLKPYSWNFCYPGIPTVDGRNPAPSVIYETPWKMGYLPYLPVVGFRPSKVWIHKNQPASSKGCCLILKDGELTPLTIHSAPLGRSRKDFMKMGKGLFSALLLLKPTEKAASCECGPKNDATTMGVNSRKFRENSKQPSDANVQFL